MEAALLAVAVGAKGAIGPALIEKHEAQSRSSSFSHALKELRLQCATRLHSVTHVNSCKGRVATAKQLLLIATCRKQSLASGTMA
eukprot:2266408-Amphidinium_carterae.2